MKTKVFLFLMTMLLLTFFTVAAFGAVPATITCPHDLGIELVGGTYKIEFANEAPKPLYSGQWYIAEVQKVINAFLGS